MAWLPISGTVGINITWRVQVGVWQAVVGYTLASSCGLLWCIEGVVNSALHGDAHSGLLRSSKFSRCREFHPF